MGLKYEEEGVGEEGGVGEGGVGKEELTRLILNKISASSEITFIVTGKLADSTELSARAA